MTVFDCFNGDADGLCALTQLRLANPIESQLITGVKRDINLLKRVSPQQNDRVNALDISMDKNKSDLVRILEAGASVFYCDHHYTGEVPASDRLDALINTTPEVCTSLLINQHLNGAFLEWAVVGTFGDNLNKSARSLAKPLGFTESKLSKLEQLGVYLNYNAYGASLDDLHFTPEALYKRVVRHAKAMDFIEQDSETFERLEQGYQGDMALAAQTQSSHQNDDIAVFTLPNKAWSRRVSGVFGNDLANQSPNRAHAVLTQNDNNGFLVSVRAPLNNRQGADQICRQFESGGGRAAAAGINHLPESELGRFVDTFAAFYCQH